VNAALRSVLRQIEVGRSGRPAAGPRCLTAVGSLAVARLAAIVPTMVAVTRELSGVLFGFTLGRFAPNTPVAGSSCHLLWLDPAPRQGPSSAPPS
jgi:hypothetical protein